jgi:hypothetical protein
MQPMNRQNCLALTADALTRRQLIIDAALVGGVAASANCEAGTDDGISHTAESIHQEPVFEANRSRVYEALTDARQFRKVVQLSAAMQSAMSLGSKSTEISQQVDGAFNPFRRPYRGPPH